MAKQSPPDPHRLPPQNLDAERSLLGSLLLSSHAIDEIAELLQPSSFYHPGHQKLYESIFRLYTAGSKAIDAVTVAEDLTRHGQLEEVGGVNAIMEVLETVPHAAHARYYANIISEKATLRALIHSCHEILQECFESTSPSDEILGKAEQKIFRILEQQDNTEKVDIRDILMDAWDRINERLNSEGTISGLSTGFVDLDTTTNGFQPSELVVLAARPSMGKDCTRLQFGSECRSG